VDPENARPRLLRPVPVGGLTVLHGFATEMRRRPTQAEGVVAEALGRLGLRFVQQQPFTGGSRQRIADFYLPDQRMVLEVDGSHHETDEEQIRDDRVRDVQFRAIGIATVRVSNRLVLAAGVADTAILLRIKIRHAGESRHRPVPAALPVRRTPEARTPGARGTSGARKPQTDAQRARVEKFLRGEPPVVTNRVADVTRGRWSGPAKKKPKRSRRQKRRAKARAGFFR